jgi:hypothetical protein
MWFRPHKYKPLFRLLVNVSDLHMLCQILFYLVAVFKAMAPVHVWYNILFSGGCVFVLCFCGVYLWITYRNPSINNLRSFRTRPPFLSSQKDTFSLNIHELIIITVYRTCPKPHILFLYSMYMLLYSVSVLIISPAYNLSGSLLWVSSQFLVLGVILRFLDLHVQSSSSLASLSVSCYSRLPVSLSHAILSSPLALTAVSAV